MNIIRSSEDFGGLLPEAIEILHSDFQIPLYYRDYKLRHPLGIYNLSLGDLSDDFQEVLDKLESLTINKSRLEEPLAPDFGQSLLRNQRQLLYALMEHMEDCQNILMCFFPKGDSYRKNPIVKTYEKAIEEYRDHIGKVVNHSKHSQGRLRLIVVFDETYTIPGYFVEGIDFIDGQDVATPSPLIHTTGLTAFSFARDIRYHFYNLYLLSKHLSDAIKVIVGDKRTPLTNLTSAPNMFLNMGRRIEKLPMLFFKDEMLLEVPTIKVLETDDITTLTLTYPDNLALLISPPSDKKMMVSNIYKGDGVIKSYRTPYISPDANYNNVKVVRYKNNNSI